MNPTTLFVIRSVYRHITESKAGKAEAEIAKLNESQR